MVGVLHRTRWSGRGAAITLDRFIASLRRLNHKGLNQRMKLNTIRIEMKLKD